MCPYSRASVLSVLMFPSLWGQVTVTTQHNDLNRSGSNPSETILNTSNVNVNSFGKLFSLAVDGEIYAQPLYMPGMTIPGQGVHNVVYICTANNSVYAYDADSATQSNPLWMVNLGPAIQSSVLNVTRNILPQIGITSTPTIDPTSNTLYVVAETYESSQAIFRLHALDITTGAEKFDGPVVIQGSVAGTGDSSSGGVVPFVPIMHWQRTGLLLWDGNIYIGFGAHEDQTPYHGWIFTYSASTLTQGAVLCTTPNGSDGGVWQGGVGLTVDSETGYLYLETGNGTMDANTGNRDYGDSILKLNPSLAIDDYFSPSNQAALANDDADLSSAGAMLLPGTSLGVGMGKQGTIFLFNRNNLGQYNPGGDQVVQEWQATYNYLSTGDAGFFGGPVYYNSTLYVWGRRDTLKAFSFNGSTFNTVPQTGAVTVSDGYSNEPALSISGNGTTTGTGILWATYSTNGDANDGAPNPGFFQALNAATLTEIWDSNQNASRDSLGSWAKWTPPTIANGKVYVPTFDDVVHVYGLLAQGTGGTLLGSGNSSAAAVNLTTEGSLDWEHFGDGNLNRKAGVTAQLTNYTVVGSGGVLLFSNDPRPISWSDGTPTADSSNNLNGIYINGVGQGFSLTAPADATSRMLVVHAGGWNSGGTFTAQLSDGSAPAFIDTTATASGQFDRNYTLTYNAGSAGQTLTITWTMVSGTGNVTLNAAAISTPAPSSIAATAGTPQSATVNTAFATALQVTVTNSAGNPVSGATVTFTAPTSGSSATFAGSATATSSTNSSGIATAPTLTAGSVPGAYVVLANVAGVSTATWFSLTNNPSTPSSIAATAGTPQSASINSAFATALQATVKDQFGNPVSGATVTFASPASGAGATFGGSSVVTTNASGVATAPALTANGTAGAYTVTATVSGVSTVAGFSLTNLTNVTNTGGGNSSWYSAAWSDRKPITIAYTQVSGGANLTNFPVLISIPNDANLQASAKPDGSDILFTASDGVTKFNHEVEFYSAATGQLIAWVQVPSLSASANTMLFMYYGNPSASPQQNAAGVWDANYAGVWHMANDAANTTVSDSTSPANNGTAQSDTNVLTTTGEIAEAVAFNGVSDYVNVVRNGNFGLSGQAFTLEAWVRDDTPAAGMQSPFHRVLSWFDGSKNIQLGIGADTSGANRVFFVGNSAGGTGSTVPANQATTGNASTGFHQVVATFDGTSVYQLYLDGSLNNGGDNVFGGVLTLYAGDSTNLYMGQRGDGAYLSGTLDEVRISRSARSPGWIVTQYNNQSSPSTFASIGTVQSGGVPASITATAGTPQSAIVNTAFANALQATVQDSGGNPVSNATVTFAAPSSGAGATFSGSSTVTTNASGVATAPALTANGAVGAYAVTASVSGVSAPASFSLTNTAGVVGGGSLTGSGTSAASAVNLTTEGILDWEHFGDGSLNRKAGVTPQLTSYTVVGNGSVFFYGNDPRPISWSDGTPAASSSNNLNGIYINGVGQGFSLTAPANTTSRTLVVHVGGWNSGGTLTALLSDGSAPEFIDTTDTASGQFDRNYTLTYNAASAGQTLTITWTMVFGTGNVTLNAAALEATGSLTTGSLTGSGTSLASAVNLTTEGTLDWEHFGDGGTLNRKAGVTAQLTSYTVVGIGSVPLYSNDPRPISWSDGTPTAGSSNNLKGIYINGVGQGFSLTAPANIASQTLVVHVGGWDSGGILIAQLSDGSAPEFIDTTATASGQFDRNYTLTYNAASAGQTLTITWTMISGTGNVTLSAAALQ
jgi:hypothetical protein